MAINYNVVKHKFVTENFSQEDFTNEMECINLPLENIRVASEFSSVSTRFSSMAQHIWSSSSHRGNNAAELLEISIQNSTPTQCSSSEFWEANVAVGKHLSWEQWQPILKTVASVLKHENVDPDAYMLFAQIFLGKMQCTDKQREEFFACIQPPHTKNTLMNKMLEKQNTLLKKISNTSPRHELKRKFKG